MKKVVILLLVSISVLTFATACGNKKDDKKEKIDYMILVNKQNKLPDDWESKVELVDVQDFEGGTIQVEKEALEKFNELQAALLEEGVEIYLDSAYRSVKRQQEVWDQFLTEYGEEYTKKYVAVPGFSEHHTGLAIDICIKKDGRFIYDNDEMTAEKEIFSKIHAKLADYGFILRYPEGKQDITGYGPEVWHFRYIKDIKVAKEIMSNGLTFEEYLESK